MGKYLVVAMSVVLIGLGVGCASLSHIVTPADIDQRAVEFVTEAGIAEPNEFSGWPSLQKAEKLDSYVDMAYEIQLNVLKHSIEDLEIDYSQINDIVTKNLAQANAREELLFSEKGLFSMGLGLAGMGGFTGLLGLMRRKPGDWSPQEVEEAMAALNDEIGLKEDQFKQVVVGVQKFKELKESLSTTIQQEGSDPLETMDLILAALKTELSKAQDAETQKVVAATKATL